MGQALQQLKAKSSSSQPRGLSGNQCEFQLRQLEHLWMRDVAVSLDAAGMGPLHLLLSGVSHTSLIASMHSIDQRKPTVDATLALSCKHVTVVLAHSPQHSSQ
jgi:hypothetical protein